MLLTTTSTLGEPSVDPTADPTALPSSGRGAVLDRLADSGWTGPVLALFFALGFLVCRIAYAGRGDVTRDILVGRMNAPGKVGHGITTLSGVGYDGQFYYRFALDPFKLDGLVNGIRVDTPIRTQRIGYSVLVWLLSGGHATAVPYLLILVNVASFVALAVIGGHFARGYGRAPLWGLAFCAFSGSVVTLSRDLTELFSAALVLGALLAVQRNRPLVAGIVLTAAALSRETAVILIVALFLTRLYELVRTHSKPGRPDLSWTIPGVGFLVWQLYLLARYHELPAHAERSNESFPGSAPSAALLRWVHGVNSTTELFPYTVVALAVLVVLGFTAARQAAAATVTALALAVLLTLSLSRDVWNDDPSELRTLIDVHIYGVAVLLQTRPSRLAIYVGTAAPALVLTTLLFATTL